ncbi:hypothetical protein [Psychroserpens algicola]|uniref:Uncharacterized protein n=1 Tax=Psychroserpens algicola TaxID=1719034 RepID=A0ABT0HCZ3_9FLAO|nr:hypothetical protein [Psychroserpens algicola]MCK8482231.1 hypothetical protein [Psychroserpens algicola]
MQKTLLCTFLLSFLLFTSCKNEEKSRIKEDYKFFNLSQQDWKSKQINQFINDINYTATEVPLQYYILKNTSEQDLGKLDSIYTANSKERIIEIEFQHAAKVDLLLEEYTQKSYEDAVKYMSFQIEKDFTVITSSNDTIKCSGALFERNFKVAPFKRALLYFNNINPDDTIKLIYQDQLFGNGTIKFNFSETPIKL